MEKLKKFSLLCLVLTLCVVLLAGCGDDEDSGSSKSKKKKNNNTTNETTSSVSSKEADIDKIEKEPIGYTERGEYVFKLRNTSKKDVYIERAELNFFDENNSFVVKANAHDMYFVIPAETEIISYVPSYSLYNTAECPTVEINLITSTPFYEYYTNAVTISLNDTGSQLAATFTNSSTTDIETVKANIVFKKDGKIIGITDTSTSYGSPLAKDGGIAYANVSYPSNKNYERCTFDSYEVCFINAYSYKD